MQSSWADSEWARAKSQDLRGRQTDGISQTDRGNRMTDGSRATGIRAPEIMCINWSPRSKRETRAGKVSEQCLKMPQIW